MKTILFYLIFHIKKRFSIFKKKVFLNKQIYPIKKKSDSFNFIVLLTQYKRDNLRNQLIAIKNQSLKPDLILVLQNEIHIDISQLKNEFSFEHIQSTINTKFFGRFALCLSIQSEYVIILDDDMIPGPNCFKNYLNECKLLNGIIGGNGRIAEINPNRGIVMQPPDTGIRPKSVMVDYVGHMWVFKREWLKYMFREMPFTLETGEDMHFCLSSKLYGNISSYCCKQSTIDELSDTSHGILSTDRFSSYLNSDPMIRISIENYFKKLGLNFITKYDQVN